MLAFASSARADDTNAVQDIVAVLQQKGLIDEATGDEILAKQERSDAKRAAAPAPVSAGAPGLTEGFIWSGDFRLRNEQFWYGNAFGGSADDVNQFRYRARLGFTKQVNSWALIGMQLASGTGNYRSSNVSFGQTSDFSPFALYINRAYAQFTLPDPGDVGLKSTLTAGRIPNPFIWKNSLDKIIWDDDINPSGFALSSSWSPMEGTTIFGNVGYFVELTQTCCTDTKVFGFQLGGSTTLADKLVAGARASYYDWDNVSADPTFASRSESFGNLPTAFDDDAHIGETSVFMTWSGIEGWPIEVWGTLAYNFSAQAGTVDNVHVDQDATAYGYGVELGSSKGWFLLGLEYQHIEANSVLALYTDSDMFDGFTNREGWGVYVGRELAANTDLRITLWDEYPIKTTASGEGNGPYNISTSSDHQATRKRLQA
ncbi:MAG: putative porin, partial [bacterium]